MNLEMKNYMRDQFFYLLCGFHSDIILCVLQNLICMSFNCFKFVCHRFIFNYILVKKKKKGFFTKKVPNSSCKNINLETKKVRARLVLLLCSLQGDIDHSVYCTICRAGPNPRLTRQPPRASKFLGPSIFWALFLVFNFAHFDGKVVG